MDQQLFNIVLSIAAFFGGWWMKVLRESLRDLQIMDKELMDKVAAIELLVAGQYVKNDKFEKFAEKVLQKLDRLVEKRTKEIQNENNSSD